MRRQPPFRIYATNAIGAERRGRGIYANNAINATNAIWTVRKLGLMGLSWGMSNTRVGGESGSCRRKPTCAQGWETFLGEKCKFAVAELRTFPKYKRR